MKKNRYTLPESFGDEYAAYDTEETVHGDKLLRRGKRGEENYDYGHSQTLEHQSAHDDVFHETHEECSKDWTEQRSSKPSQFA